MCFAILIHQGAVDRINILFQFPFRRDVLCNATALATLKTVGIIGRKGALQMAFDSGLLKPLAGLDVEQSIDQLLSESLDELI